MAEQEATNSVEGARLLPDKTTRKLIILRGYAGLVFEDFNSRLVSNQARFGRGTDDYVSMVIVHSGNTTNPIDKILGVREEVSKRCRVIIDGQETEFVEADPKVRNIWVGEFVKLLTPQEAANTEYVGNTALKWATQGGKTPDMIVKTSNGYFYPATMNDVVMSDKV